MKTPTQAIVTLLLVCLLPAVSFSAQKSHGCSDISTKITILGFDGSALSPDRSAPYEDGVDGVYNAVIHICGTGDATMNLLTNSRRTVGFTFPAALPGSIINGPSPVWANGVLFQARPGFGIRNIIWGRTHATTTPNTFTTTMGIGSIVGPQDKSTYRLPFRPLVTDAVMGEGFGLPGDQNSPNIASYVTVEDIPGTCRTVPNGTLDKWIVTASNPSPTAPGYLQVGTLYKESKNTLIHSGQYTFPFKLMIEATTCLPNL